MCLHERAGLEESRRDSARIADALELFAEHGAVGADGGERLLERIAAGVDKRAEHIRRVAYPFFIGEGNDGNGARRHKPGGLERFHDLKRRENAIAAVKLPRIDHSVDVRAGHDRFCLRAAFRCPDAEEISDVVGHDGESCLAHPAGHKIAPCLVLIGGGKAGAAAVSVDADSAERVDTVQKTGLIDSQHRIALLKKYRFRY